MLSTLLKSLKLLFALFSFLCVFYVIAEFTRFVSFPRQFVQSKVDPWASSARALLIDMLLLSVFILQHSVMASESFKQLIFKLHLSDLGRSVYNVATAGVLWATLNCWQTTTHQVLWAINLNYKPLWYLYCAVHGASWIVIYVASICTDITELFGLKQVYYNIRNLPDPNIRKSHQLRKLTSHMRHPSFLGFLLIFWFVPIMTLDKLLLSAILTAYMYIAWNTDGEDYNYQKYMFHRKYHELQRLSNGRNR